MAEELVEVNVLRMTAHADPVMTKDKDGQEVQKYRTKDLGGYTVDEPMYRTVYYEPGLQKIPAHHAKDLVDNGHAEWPAVVTPLTPDLQAPKGTAKKGKDPDPLS